MRAISQYVPTTTFLGGLPNVTRLATGVSPTNSSKFPILLLATSLVDESCRDQTYISTTHACNGRYLYSVVTTCSVSIARELSRIRLLNGFGSEPRLPHFSLKTRHNQMPRRLRDSTQEVQFPLHRHPNECPQESTPESPTQKHPPHLVVP
jgi:hypothetical protein